MYIYLVKRKDFAGYDEYDSFVVICQSETVARGIHPNGEDYFANEVEYEKNVSEWCDRSWVPPKKVDVFYVGKADLTTQELAEFPKVDSGRVEAYIVSSSFNAG